MDEWLTNIPVTKTIHNKSHLGYYASVKTVMDEWGRGDYVVLRDTVVLTPKWLEYLQEAAYSSDNIAIATPITSTNPFYEFTFAQGDNLLTSARKIDLLSEGQCPELPIPDINVYYLRNDALRIVPFPGTPNDVTSKPFVQFVVDLSKKAKKVVLAERSLAYVSTRHNIDKKTTKSEVVKQIVPLDRPLFEATVVASQEQDYKSLSNYRESDIQLVNERTLGIIVSSLILRGGVLILTELCNDLILEGIDVKVFLINPQQRESNRFDLLFEPYQCKKPQEIAARLPQHASLVATFWNTAQIVEQVSALNPNIKGYYFIQDFEPYFYDLNKGDESEYYHGAIESYSRRLTKITTSQWIISKIRDHVNDQNLPVKKFQVGLNLELFYPSSSAESTDRSIRIIAMARPETPRRGFKTLIRALHEIKQTHCDIQISLFGGKGLQAHNIPFEYDDLGVLNQEQLREHYSASQIFIDSSNFQGFGLAPLEAMACGCACVFTDSGGINEFAEHGQNCMIVPTKSPSAIAEAVQQIIGDISLRKFLIKNACETAKLFSHHNLADNFLQIINKQQKQWQEVTLQKASSGYCNVIIPIFNEIHKVRWCLDSVAKYTDIRHRIILVDDFSDSYNQARLKEIADANENFIYVRNSENLGFVGTVNQGISKTSEGDIVLLNSDTVVTPNWLEKLYECSISDSTIGIISPLSTCSSHLAISPNPGDSIFDVAEGIKQISKCDYPDIITPEGWCFYIKRHVYELLGGFDSLYGRGYCEESDYSMKALANGFRLVCCDNAFVYHEGMVTFKEQRGERYRINRKIFDRRWKPFYLKKYEEFLSRDPLSSIRIRYKTLTHKDWARPDEISLQGYPEVITILDEDDNEKNIEAWLETVKTSQKSARQLTDSGKIIFVLSVLQPYGGVLSVMHLVNDLVMLGVDVKLVVLSPKGLSYGTNLLVQPILFSDTDNLVENFPDADIIVGTLWITMYYLAKLVRERNNFLPAYFIQDFEPLFQPKDDSDLYDTVIRTYQLPAIQFAKTPWIKEKVESSGGHVDLVPPAIDLDLFYPRNSTENSKADVILTMLRPDTPQRGTDTAIAVLKRIYTVRPDLEIHVFGLTNDQLQKLNLSFPVKNHGIVKNDTLPILYAAATLFVDFSLFHGFGRTIAEAMACAVPCVITESGGISLFAEHEKNCLIAGVGDVEDLTIQIMRVIEDGDLRRKLAGNARKSVIKFDRINSARATQQVLCGFDSRQTGSSSNVE